MKKEERFDRGYKETDAGVIPNEWECLFFENGLVLQRGFDLPSRLREDGSVPIVTSSGVNSTHSKSRIVGPGIVTGRYGTIGQVFYIEEDFWPLNTTLYVKDFKGNNPLYLSYLLRTIDFESHSGKSGVPGVNRNDIHKLRIALPPISEQRAIASALSDVDALLAALDRLIAKKRDLKQAAMQQLLTGQTRLPGFKGQWLSKQFGEVVFTRRERIDPRKNGPQEFCVELEHINPVSGDLIGNTTSGDQVSLKSVFYPEDVLFGKLRAYLRKYWFATRKGVCSTEIWVLVPRDGQIASKFLFQIIRTEQFIELASYSYGTHMPRSDWSVVKNFEMKLPPLHEQMAIVEILSDMDTEIKSLEQRLAKTRALKQGMMQELLTGRIRLVTPQSSPKVAHA